MLPPNWETSILIHLKRVTKSAGSAKVVFYPNLSCVYLLYHEYGNRKNKGKIHFYVEWEPFPYMQNSIPQY